MALSTCCFIAVSVYQALLESTRKLDSHFIPESKGMHGQKMATDVFANKIKFSGIQFYLYTAKSQQESPQGA